MLDRARARGRRIGRAGPARRAFSLAELLATLLILGLALGAIGRVLGLHSRRFADLERESAERVRLREGAAIIASALRDVSPTGGDLYPGTLGTGSLEFRRTLGHFVACNASGGAVGGAPPTDGGDDPEDPTLDVVPLADHGGVAPLDAAATGPAESPSPVAPQPVPVLPDHLARGDSVLIHRPGSSLGAADDGWTAHLVLDVAAVDCAAPVAAPGHRLSLSPPPGTALGAPTLVRSFRRTRFTLYQAADGDWYLGTTDCNPTRTPQCPPLQPVSGPYAAMRAGRDSLRSGIHLAYLDSAGAAASDPGRVARIGVSLRPPERADNPRGHGALSTAIAFRNRR